MSPAKFSPALAIMICLLLWAICDQLWSALSWGHESWPLSECLINYAGGFVRRGLPGSVIGMLSAATGIQANHIAIFSCLFFYLLLAVWFLRCSTRVFPATLVLSCIVMGFAAYQDAIVRKDCLGLLLFLGCLRIDRSHLPRPLAMVLVNLLAGMAILSHETFAFYALPALILFNHRNQERPVGRQLLGRSLAMLPAIGCFLLAVIFHGSPRIADAVNDSWLPLWCITDPENSRIGDSASAIQALGWTTEQGLSLAIGMLTSGLYQPMAWATVFTISFALVVLFTGRDTARNTPVALDLKIEVTAILLLQLFFISPLFLLGFDYGRWLFFWMAGSIMLHTERRQAPVWMESSVKWIFGKTNMNRLLSRVPASDWYLLFFGVPVCWNIHGFLIASPAGRHLHIIGSWF